MKKLLAIAAAACAVTGAQAATVSFNFLNALQTTEISQSGNLGLFNSVLGTLTSATLTFSGRNSTNLSLTNTAAQAQTVRATSGTDLFFGSSLAALNPIILAANPVLSLSATTGFVVINPNATAAFGPLTDSRNLAWTSQISGILASFSNAGGGNFALTCTSLSSLTLTGGGGNVQSTQATQAGCGGTILYTYTPRVNQVPEPASLALVGVALAAAGVVSRRRKG